MYSSHYVVITMVKGILYNLLFIGIINLLTMIKRFRNFIHKATSSETNK